MGKTRLQTKGLQHNTIHHIITTISRDSIYRQHRAPLQRGHYHLYPMTLYYVRRKLNSKESP